MTNPQIVNLNLILETKLDHTIFLRSIYRTKQHKKIIDHLSQTVTSLQEETKHICHVNYKDFLDSVDVFFSTKQSVHKLSKKINQFNENIQLTGAKLVATRLELNQTKKMLSNLDQYTLEFDNCLHVLKLANSFNKYFANEEFYLALKVLDQLTEMSHYYESFEFGEYLHVCIPNMKHMIKNRIILNKREWLYSIKPKINTIMQNVFKNNKTNAKHSNNTNIDLRELEVDISPILQCIHVHRELKQSRELVKSFQEDRRAQFNYMISQNLKLTNTKELVSQLSDLCGFFVVEKQLLYLTKNFRSIFEVNTLFDTCIDIISGHLNRALSESNTAVQESLYKNCNQFNIFCMIVKKFGYSVVKLEETLLKISHKQ